MIGTSETTSDHLQWGVVIKYPHLMKAIVISDSTTLNIDEVLQSNTDSAHDHCRCMHTSWYKFIVILQKLYKESVGKLIRS